MGFDLGFEAAGFETAWFSEIDPNCNQILARHRPKVRNYGDISKIKTETLPAVTVMVGGFPCQDLSVAGKRGGLQAERSGLFFEFARLADAQPGAWLVIENVPGLFSSNRGEDFAVLLGRLTGHRPEVPAGGWKNSGACVGPDRSVAWGVLDAQWFGVAQRRRRVFVVASPGGGPSPVPVLFEREGRGGDTPPGREEGTRVAPVPEERPGEGVTPTLTNYGKDWNEDPGKDGTALVTDRRVVPTLNASATGTNRMGGPRLAAEHEYVVGPDDRASTLQAAGAGRGYRIDAESAAGGHLIAATPSAESEISPTLQREYGRNWNSVTTHPGGPLLVPKIYGPSGQDLSHALRAAHGLRLDPDRTTYVAVHGPGGEDISHAVTHARSGVRFDPTEETYVVHNAQGDPNWDRERSMALDAQTPPAVTVRDAMYVIQDVRGGTRDKTSRGQGIGIRKGEVCYTLGVVEQHAVAIRNSGRDADLRPGRMGTTTWVDKMFALQAAQRHAVAYQCHGSNVGPMGTLRTGNAGLTGGIPFVYAPSRAAPLTSGSKRTPGVNVPGRRMEDDVNLVVALQDKKSDKVHPAAGTGFRVNGPSYTQAAMARHAVAYFRPGRRDAVQVQWASGGGNLENPTAQALRAGAEHNYQFARTGMVVRRLTPRECERLQAFPDDWTALDADGKPVSDSARYRMLGNAVCSSVAYWVARRLRAVMDGRDPDDEAVDIAGYIRSLNAITTSKDREAYAIRTGGDFADPTITVDDKAFLAANPMSDRQMAVGVSFKPSHYTRGKDGGPSTTVPPLSADADKGDQEAVIAVGFNTKETTGALAGIAPTLRAESGDPHPGGRAAVAYVDPLSRPLTTEYGTRSGYADGYVETLVVQNVHRPVPRIVAWPGRSTAFIVRNSALPLFKVDDQYFWWIPERPHGLAVRTRPPQGRNGSSILPGATSHTERGDKAEVIPSGTTGQVTSTILVGHVLDALRSLPAESVHCVVTSPPYWGLRDYKLEPQVWGGDPKCAHRWGDEIVNAGPAQKLGTTSMWGDADDAGYVKARQMRGTPQGAFCQDCGAWRGALGLEPTPSLYVQHLVEVFREIRRVLRRDGTAWLNLGDSYATQAGKGANVPQTKNPRVTYPEDAPHRGKRIERGEGRWGGGNNPAVDGIKPKDLVGIPWRAAFALQQPYHVGPIKQEKDRAWLAAMIDSDGFMGIRKQHPREGRGTNETYIPYTGIAQTDTAALEYAQSITGLGTIVVKAEPGDTDERGIRNTRTLYSWRLDGQQASVVVREIYPHLRIKKLQAQIVYAMNESLRWGRPTRSLPVPPEVMRYRRRLYEAVKALNQHQMVDVSDLPEVESADEPGWWLRQDIVWAKPNPMPESVRDRCTRSHEYIFMFAKSPTYFYDNEAIKEPLAEGSIKRLSQPTFDQQTGGPKDYATTGENANRSARRALENLAWKFKEGYADKQFKHDESDRYGKRNPNRVFGDPESMARIAAAGRNKRDVWTFPTKPYRGAHFAVFPEALPTPCILAGTSEAGCCSRCGAPLERSTERRRVSESGPMVSDGRKDLHGPTYSRHKASVPGGQHISDAVRETVGWDPTCLCEAKVVPCTVLEPFAGSGTTLYVSAKHGRNSVGIELQKSYVPLIRDRLAKAGRPVEVREVAVPDSQGYQPGEE